MPADYQGWILNIYRFSYGPAAKASAIGREIQTSLETATNFEAMRASLCKSLKSNNRICLFPHNLID